MALPTLLKHPVYRQLRAAILSLITTVSLTATLALSLGNTNPPEPQNAPPQPWPERVRPQPPSEPNTSAEAPGQRAQGLSLSTLDTPKVQLQLDTATVDADLLARPRLGQGLGKLPGTHLDGLELGRHGDVVFDLGQLDSTPVVMYRPQYKMPKALRDAGVPDTLVQVHVMIHEDGRLTLIAYEDLPYPELKPVVEGILRKMRYTSPEKNGRRVKAEFLLPLNLEGT